MKRDEPPSVRLTKFEASTVAKGAALGLAGGILYGFGRMFLQQGNSTTPLSPETESLHVLPHIRSLFVELQDYKYADPVAFGRSVNMADTYARQYDLIMSDNKFVTERVHNNAYKFYRLTRDAIKHFVNASIANKKVPPEHVVEVNKISVIIQQELIKTYKILTDKKNILH